MKRKVLYILVLLGVLVTSLTGCGSQQGDKGEINGEKINNDVQSSITNTVTNNDEEISESNNSRLSLEKFKIVMKNHNLNVVCMSTEAQINNLKHENIVYMVEDSKNRTHYSLNVYRKEDDAKRAFGRWTYSKPRDDFKVSRNEENDHLRKYVVDASNGRHFYFRDYEVILVVDVSEDAADYDSALKSAENILKELDF